MALSTRASGAIMIVAGVVSLGLLMHEQARERAEETAKQAAAQAAEKAAQPAQSASLTQVIGLWTGQPVPGEPMGVHVADVSVDTAGLVTVLLADNVKTRAAVDAAIAQAKGQPALPFSPLAASTGAAPGSPAQAAGGAARPGDPHYPQAVADFLGAKTGYKPQLQGR